VSIEGEHGGGRVADACAWSNSSHAAATPQELADALGLSQQNVSKHLQILHRSGLVMRRPDGANVFYALKDESTVKLLEDVSAASRSACARCRPWLPGFPMIARPRRVPTQVKQDVEKPAASKWCNDRHIREPGFWRSLTRCPSTAPDSPEETAVRRRLRPR